MACFPIILSVSLFILQAFAVEIDPPVAHLEQSAVLDSTRKPMITGGFSEERPGDEYSQNVANIVRPHVERKLGAEKVTEYVVEKYRTQVVAGTNYLFKIRVAPGKYIHAAVFQPLSSKPENHQLNGLESAKALGDPLNHIKRFTEQ